jgi:release factor glutamine methyltransferase
MFVMMSAKNVYDGYISSLKDIYSISEAAAITDIVFESIAGTNRSDIVSDSQKELTENILNKLHACLEELILHKPVQYVLGEAWFLNLKLKVTLAVLIPRPETEELVLEVIKYCKENHVKTVIDIGTGSGCIPIALKKNIPSLNISAIDISEDALKVATENSETHHTEITFSRIDFLEENNWERLNQFDIIVSNPPYIPIEEKQLMDKNVIAYEPHAALFVANNTAIIFYEKIALFGKKHLAENGKIFLETHKDYTQQVADHFTKNGYDAVVLKDMFGKNRFVTATHSQ